MSKQVVLYFMRMQSMSQAKCAWFKQYYELRASGRLASVTVYENGVTHCCAAHPDIVLPSVTLCTREQYRAARLQHVRYLLQRRREEREAKEARKLLREGGLKKSKPATQEASVVEVPQQVGHDVRVVSDLSMVSGPAPAPADILADYTVFDCETTGFSHEKDHLLELAATRYTNGVPVDSMQSFVRFTGWIPPKITELTTITTQHVFRAPDVRDVLVEFKRLAGDSLLVGHNVAFDLRFVNAARARLGATAPLPNRFLCTQVLATSRYPDISHKLGELCKRFGISTSGAHRAGNDVLMTAKLLQLLHQQQPIAPHLIGQTSAPKPKAVAQPALFD